MKLERKGGIANRYTFKSRPAMIFVMEYYKKGELWIDPFAGKFSPVSYEHRNDLNEDMDTNYHLHAKDFFNLYKDGTVDGIIFDPPFSLTELKRCYEDIGRGKMTMEEAQKFPNALYYPDIIRVLKKGGKLLKFNHDSNRIGKGFEIEHQLNIAHGGGRFDTLCTLQVKQ